MMKNIVLIVSVFFISFSQAQVESPFRVQIYTGGPSLFKTAFKFSSSFQDLVKYNDKALLGFSADFRLTERISIGLDATYRYGELNMDISDSSDYEYLLEKWGLNEADILDPFGHYKLEIPRLRIMAVMTTHFLNSDNPSDLYAQLGLGYNRVKPILTLDDSEVEFFNRIANFSLPLAYRLSLGYSYYFKNYLGVFGEVGVGGPIFSFGITSRF